MNPIERICWHVAAAHRRMAWTSDGPRLVAETMLFEYATLARQRILNIIEDQRAA